MDAFDAIFADTSKTRGTVTQKRPDGSTRTAKLAVGPIDMSPAGFGDAAMKGATFAEKMTDGDTTRTRTRPAVSGAAARSALTCMMGFNEAEISTDSVPPAVRNRSKPVMPSVNGKAEDVPSK